MWGFGSIKAKILTDPQDTVFENGLEGLRQDLGILSEISHFKLLSVTYDLENSWKIFNNVFFKRDTASLFSLKCSKS